MAGSPASADRVLRVRSRLTDRDLLLLDWLADHTVLTTVQIGQALFPSLDSAQERLGTLHHLGLVDRFRPLRPGGGSYPWHYVLGHTGAEFVAAARGERTPRRVDTVTAARRTAASRTLTHQLGTNGFFTSLAGHARTHPHTSLDRWWSERQCATPGAFGQSVMSTVRPDGHGIWADHDTRVAFFLEYDTGSESHTVLTAKLTRYTALVAAGGPRWPVLFAVPSAARERPLHQLLTTLTVTIPVATSIHHTTGHNPSTRTPSVRTTSNRSAPTRSATTERTVVRRDVDGSASTTELAAPPGPADAVWLVHGSADPPRRLADLAGLGDPAPAM